MTNILPVLVRELIWCGRSMIALASYSILRFLEAGVSIHVKGVAIRCGFAITFGYTFIPLT